MKFLKIKSADMPTKPKPTEQLPNNLMYVWDPNANDWIILQKDTNKATPPLYDPNNQNVTNQTTSYMSTIKSSCLSKFLDGPKYSKEIKIEAGLIKNGLVKYAGFDFNRGTKYAITTKGLEVLRKASEQEHNEALNEREKLAYMFGFNTDKVSTLDTTGKVIKSDKKYTICEADGTELGEVDADNELDAKVKFCIEHPEYADSQSISAKEICASNADVKSVYVYDIYWNDRERELRNVLYDVPYETLPSSDYIDIEIANVDDYDSIKSAIGDALQRKYDERAESFEFEIKNKKIDAQYEQITNTKEPYPNPSETPNDHIVLENHDGWVNTAEQKVTPEFAKLHKLLGEYKKQSLITLTDLDGNLVATGDPQIINELEHQVKALGYHCEAVDEYTDSDYAETYSLKIFMK